MRSIALLAGLLVAIGGGTAASAASAASAATEPAGTWAVSAICAHEFATAADLRIEEEAVATEVGDEAAGEVVAEEAAQVGGPAAQAGPTDASTDDASNTSLDAAIRACASIDDWLSAARLFPEALGSADATAFLDARCSDPTSGLEPYSACHSLADAMATPAPVVVPDPRPVVVEPDVEGIEPVEPIGVTPDSSAGTRASKGDRRKRSQSAATVARDFTARIPGATAIRYFRITGDTPARLLRQNQRKAGRHCGDHRAIACVLMHWTVAVTKDFSSGKCAIGKASTTLQSTVFLPRWANRGSASRDLVRWWRAVMRDSAVHEARHIRIQRRHLADFRRMARGRPCGSATIIFNRHMASANKAQAAFDRVEYQKPLPPLPASLLR